MFRKAILVYREDTCRIKRKVVRLVECDTLWRTIDIHTFHRSVALHDTLTGSIVSVTTCFAIIREYHESVVLIPIHLPRSVGTVICYQRRITVGIIRVMIVTNLCWSRWMVTVLIFISEVIRLGSRRNYQQVAPSNSRILVIGI